MKHTFCLWLLLCLVIIKPQLNAIQTNQIPKVPDSILRLLTWPSPEIIAEKQVPAQPVNDSAAYGTERWLQKVIDPTWLPTQLEPICIAGEFEGRDVVRYKWSKAGYSFMVAQTFSIFVMEIRPESGKLDGGSIEELLSKCRELCEQVLAKNGKRWTGQREEVAISNLNKKIVDFSFDPINVVQMTNVDFLLSGRPKGMNEEGVKLPMNNTEINIQDSKTNIYWEKSAFAWMYWFRNVYWFADSNRLVLYFLSDEGGPIGLSFYGGVVEQRWFHNFLEARLTLKPEALEVSPGILTAFVRLPEGYSVSGIASATCDGAPSERMMPNDDATEMIIKFRRQDIEAALRRNGQSIDTNFVVRGIWRDATRTNLFQGADSITKIVGAK